MRLLRKIAGIGLLLFALQFLWIAFTVPMLAATGPILLAAGLVVLTFFVWPSDEIGRAPSKPSPLQCETCGQRPCQCDPRDLGWG